MAVSEFEEQLLRLKQQLGLSEDKDVAAALGMAKAAFSARKARDSFPEDKLHALHSRRPELGLDVPYVLTGKSGHGAAAAAAASTVVVGRRAADALSGAASGNERSPGNLQPGVAVQLEGASEARMLQLIRQLQPADRQALDRLLLSLTERRTAQPAAANHKDRKPATKAKGRK